MLVLVLNCGSSSVKFQLIRTGLKEMEDHTEETLAKGLAEKIGSPSSTLHYFPKDKEPYKEAYPIPEYEDAIKQILQLFIHPVHGVIKDKSDIDAVGHRVVHGGEKFRSSTVITDEVLQEIIACVTLAPLHNPHNIKGYEIAHKALPDIPHVAVFDTAFHQTMPQVAYLYALPYMLYQRNAVRRYGFHGTSHYWVAERLSHLLETPLEKLKLITCHLGNGCSIAAIKHGKSIDTSMGLTPLEGLVMGTRSGDIDPAIVLHLMTREGMKHQEVDTLLNKHSGLLGISGVSNDVRELLSAAEKGDERAQLAIDVFCYRCKKYICAYAGAMGGVDAVAFTGGIGENAVPVRGKTCEQLEFLGLTIDPDANNRTLAHEGIISAPDSVVKVFVVPTNEELVIARDTVRCVEE